VKCPLARDGAGHLQRQVFKHFVQKKSTIIIIKNENDNLLLARATVVAVATLEKDPDRRYIRDGGDLQRRRAFNLCRQANVNLENGATFELIQIFQDYLTSYTITVFDYKPDLKEMFKGPLSTHTNSRKKH